MIILFGGEKGGTGKSTLATNVAVCRAKAGRDIVLIDTDAQASAEDWANLRTSQEHSPIVHCVAKFDNVKNAALDLATRYQDVIIDAGGRDSRELRTAMLAADRLCIPFRPSQYDLWTLDHTTEMVQAAQDVNENLSVLAILSMAPTNTKIKESQDAKDAFKDNPVVNICNTVIHERKIYRDAISLGLGVVELANKKAKQEIEDLTEEVFQ